MKKDRLTKEELKLMFLIAFQNIAITGLFIFLAVVFKKWWIGLFPLLTFQNIKYSIKDKDK